MLYTKENPKFITSPDEIVPGKISTKSYVKFVCKHCGKEFNLKLPNK